MTPNSRHETSSGQVEARLQDWGRQARDTAPPVQLRSYSGPSVMRMRGWGPAWLVAALVLVTVSGGVLWARQGGPLRGEKQPAAPTASQPVASTPLPPLTCPSTFPEFPSYASLKSWVPALPSGVATDGQLVPATTPASVVLCGFRGRKPLTPASTVLGGNLGEITADLSGPTTPNFAPPTCTADLPVPGADGGHSFLIGLRYPAGYIWVSEPAGKCMGSTNGQVYAQRSVVTLAQQAYRAGLWPTDAALTKACDTSTTSATLPMTQSPVSATLCTGGSGAVHAFRYDKDMTGNGSLTAEIQLAPGELAPAGCRPDLAHDGVLVILHYAGAADVVVAATRTCSNGVVVSRPPTKLLGYLTDFLANH
ncbi:MAG: hypothetical protein QOK10_1735 [Pseudonocardiales bacterium]|jgi:hypothetical protein|nr:hypothetical protein [Pseudonocardiales bacterium]